MIDHAAAHLAMRNLLLAVSSLPAARAFENVAFTPVAGTPYVAEQFVPATSSAVTVPVARALVEETGLYVVQWFGLDGAGISAVRTGVDAVLAAFAPGTSVTSTAGDVIRVRSDTGPRASQILPQPNGFAVCTITIPWYAYSQNIITA